MRPATRCRGSRKLKRFGAESLEPGYGGDASRIWADGSSGAAVARRFLAFDGVGPKIANMAVNILIRDFHIGLATPMADIAVDTHVLRVFERLGLLDRLEHSQLRSTRDIG